MVKAHMPWPCPQHVAWPSPYFNCSCTLPEPSLHGYSVYLNPSTYIFPAVSAFPGFTAHAGPSLRTEHTNEVQGFLQYSHSEPSLKEIHTGGATQLQNANSALVQKKLLIFDRCGDKTRLFYSPALQLVQSPIAAQFAQVNDVNEGEKAANMGQKHMHKYSSTEESDKDHIVNEESEMHEDTEEINALLYSDDSDFNDDDDDDDDEVTSTGHSPLVTKRTYVMQEQFEDSKEEVASSNWPNKRLKSTNGGYYRSPLPAGNAGLARLNEACEYGSDAESKYSSGPVYSNEQTKDDNATADDIHLKTDKIRESLSVLENLVPGAKGKHPLLVIDGTIEYLKSLMTQAGSLGVNNISPRTHRSYSMFG